MTAVRGSSQEYCTISYGTSMELVAVRTVVRLYGAVLSAKQHQPESREPGACGWPDDGWARRPGREAVLRASCLAKNRHKDDMSSQKHVSTRKPAGGKGRPARESWQRTAERSQTAEAAADAKRPLYETTTELVLNLRRPKLTGETSKNTLIYKSALVVAVFPGRAKQQGEDGGRRRYGGILLFDLRNRLRDQGGPERALPERLSPIQPQAQGCGSASCDPRLVRGSQGAVGEQRRPRRPPLPRR